MRLQRIRRDDLVIEGAYLLGLFRARNGGLDEVIDIAAVVEDKVVLDLGIAHQALDPWLGLISSWHEAAVGREVEVDLAARPHGLATEQVGR